MVITTPFSLYEKPSGLKYTSLYPWNWVDNQFLQAWVLLHHWFSKNLLWTLSIWVGKIYQACLESRVCWDDTMSNLWGQQCIPADKYQWRGTTVFTDFSVTFHWTMGIFLSWLWPNHNPEVLTTPSLKIPFIPGRLHWLNFITFSVLQLHGGAEFNAVSGAKWVSEEQHLQPAFIMASLSPVFTVSGILKIAPFYWFLTRPSRVYSFPSSLVGRWGNQVPEWWTAWSWPHSQVWDEEIAPKHFSLCFQPLGYVYHMHTLRQIFQTQRHLRHHRSPPRFCSWANRPSAMMEITYWQSQDSKPFSSHQGSMLSVGMPLVSASPWESQVEKKKYMSYALLF